MSPFNRILIVTLLVVSACTTQKVTLNNESLPENHLVIIGLVEYDYSALENRTIQGIEIQMKSEEPHVDIQLPDDFLPVKPRCRYEFIALTGDYGNYHLGFRRNTSAGTETGMLLTQLKLERNDSGLHSSNYIQSYTLNDGKLISRSLRT